MRRTATLLTAFALTAAGAQAQSAFQGVEGEIAPSTPRPSVTLPVDLGGVPGVSFEISRPTTEQFSAVEDTGPTAAGSFQRETIHHGQRSRRTRLTGFDVIDAILK